MSWLGRAYHRIPGNLRQWLILLWVVAVSVVVGAVYVRDTGEADRVSAEVSVQIQAEQRRLARDAAMRTRALCTQWRGQAGADVVPTTTDLGRVTVRTAAASYLLLNCEQVLHQPLPPVDPEAYRPAPASPIPR